VPPGSLAGLPEPAEIDARLSTVARSVHDAIICADTAGDITMWLGGAEEIFGFSEDEVLGTSLTALMPERFRAEHLAALTSYTHERPPRVVGRTVELAGLRRDGSEFPLELSLSEGTHAGQRFFAGIIRDISQRKRIEDELERSNAELTQFASVASHDLSEPLRIIEGFADLLSRRYRGRLDADGDVFLDHITGASVRMRALIDALLRYARAGNAPLELEQVDTRELAAQAAEALGARVRDARAEVHVARGLPPVTADATLLRQVFQNLVANALKHADREGVCVEVSAQRVGETWSFSVRDDGPGIAPDDRERIFEMFARGRRVATPAADASAPAGAHAGAGIGLSICQRVVERHGGRIWVESVPGRGADFRFTLPAEDPGDVDGA
jgi:PAS domain S-box-containing protein